MKLFIVVDVGKEFEVSIKDNKTVSDLRAEVNKQCVARKLDATVIGLRAENDALLNDDDVVGKRLQKSQRLIALLPL
jgi:hypothetical protein